MKYEGYLDKRSHGTIARWQKRYWILNGTVLLYQKKENDSSDKQEFDLVSMTNLQASEQNNRVVQFEYDDLTYLLRANNNDDMKKWLMVLTAAQMAVKSELSPPRQTDLAER